jgi:hypothetical protein
MAYDTQLSHHRWGPYPPPRYNLSVHCVAPPGCTQCWTEQPSAVWRTPPLYHYCEPCLHAEWLPPSLAVVSSNVCPAPTPIGMSAFGRRTGPSTAAYDVESETETQDSGEHGCAGAL